MLSTEQRLTTGGDCSLLRAGRTKREVVSANPAGAGTWQEVQPFLEMQVEAASVPLLPLSPLPMPPVGKYNHRFLSNKKPNETLGASFLSVSVQCGLRERGVFHADT